jgi:Ser-tRNA(Ala) deacylase AlaX
MTKLEYLDDTYLFEFDAKVVDIRNSEKGQAVILDKTIFYPQGGGQPADNGKIVFGDIIFLVNDVRLDESGDIWHFGEFKNGEFQKGDAVLLKIDQNRRIQNAKLHSAGHLIDCAILEMGLDNLKPGKGFHFPNGPYVEYEGIVENSSEMIINLQEKIDDLINKNLSIEKNNLTPKEAEAQSILAPAGKSARVINFTGFPGCGCGGTHIEQSAEIGKIIIRKIKSNKGMTKISYIVE